jgi:hypothetical protein
MRRANVMLLAAIAIAACGYTVAAFVIPHLPVRLGFEGVLVLGGAVGMISFVVAGVLAARAAINAGLALRHQKATRTAAGYATLALSSLISLGVTVIIVVAIMQA